MPAGLQCWDASGKLIVDIGDYNTRYIGNITATIPANTASVTAYHSELTKDGCFAVLVSASHDSGVNQYATRCLDGAVTIYALSTSTLGGRPGNTFSVALYGFI